MTDQEALLRSIILAPADDAPRLVYADYLDERGDKASAAKATFIRSQIRLDRENIQPTCGGGKTFGQGKAPGFGIYTHHCRCEYCKLRRAEWTAWRHFSCEWQQDFYKTIVEGTILQRIDTGQMMNAMRPAARCEFSRGFISSISVSCDDFMLHAAEMFSKYPIESASLNDKRALHAADPFFRWIHRSDGIYHGECYQLPKELFDLLSTGPSCVLVRNAQEDWNSAFSVRDYESQLAAGYALNVACCCFGRQKAGLPDLSGGIN